MIDTKAIRDRILLLALKGELVEQNPQDESASNLIDKLCRNIGDRSFEPDFSEDEIPYDIPLSWSWCRLSDIGSTNIGLTYHPDDVTENGVIVARSSNIVNGKMDYSDLVKVSCSIRENQYLNSNDILICARNGSKALVGKCAIYEGDSKKIAFGAFMAVFRTPLFRYVYYYFNTGVFKQNFISDDSKQINQVTQNILKQSLIPIPPLSEQTRIVERIEAIFEILDRIDALQNQYTANQEALKSKLIDIAIQGKLTEQLPEDGTAEELYRHIQEKKNALIRSKKFKKDKSKLEVNKEDIPFDIPDNWKWVCWGEIVNIVSARRVHQSDWRKEGIPFYRAREIAKLADNGFVDNDLYISEELYDEFSKSGVPSDGDLMVSAVGTLGKTYVVRESDHFYYKDASVLCFENYAVVDPYYLRYVMNSDMMKKQIESNSGGTTVDTLTMVRMIKYLLPLPPLATQHRIVEKLDAVLSLIA